MKKFSIYKITNKTNNKLYVGKTQGNAINRWRKHIRIANGGKEKYPRLFYAIHAAIIKYGVNNFDFEIIEEIDNESLSFEREKFWISTLAKTHQLYNLTIGGDGPSGRKPSLESRKKMSEAQRGEKSWKAKLTEDSVREIKKLLIEGKLTQKEIAFQFGVKHGMINNIYREKYWWWVKVSGFTPKPRYSSGPTNAKLGVEQIIEIKKLLTESGLTQQEIADKFGVARLTITLINTGKRWSHIT